MRRGPRQLKSILNYIDGQFVRGVREFPDVNPANGTVIAQVAEADQGLVDRAVQAARKALAGEWGRFGVRERAARLHELPMPLRHVSIPSFLRRWPTRASRCHLRPDLMSRARRPIFGCSLI